MTSDNQPTPVVLAWSGGKDSALALRVLDENPDVQVAGFMTTLSSRYRRVSHHGIREQVLEAQCEAAGLPLYPTWLDVAPHDHGSNERYEQRLGQTLRRIKADGINAVAYGDIHLEDLRKYREDILKRHEMEGVFPLWGRSSVKNARRALTIGIDARVICVQETTLGYRFAGRRYNRPFLDDLPRGVDPSGERGEFHTLVTGCPSFDNELSVSPGNTIRRDGRWFTDVYLR